MDGSVFQKDWRENAQHNFNQFAMLSNSREDLPGNETRFRKHWGSLPVALSRGLTISGMRSLAMCIFQR